MRGDGRPATLGRLSGESRGELFPLPCVCHVRSSPSTYTAFICARIRRPWTVYWPGGRGCAGAAVLAVLTVLPRGDSGSAASHDAPLRRAHKSCAARFGRPPAQHRRVSSPHLVI